MILPSVIFREMLNQIVGIERSNIITMSLILRSYKDPEFIIDELIIEAANLKQDFSSNTTDRLQLIVTIPPRDIMTLSKNQSDLYATLTVEYVDANTGIPILEEAPAVYEFLVFIHELENLAEKYGMATFENIDDPLVDPDNSSESQNLTLPINLELLGLTEYRANRSSFHGILTNVTVEDAVKFCAVNLGVTKINMIPADNDVVYRHLIIPPEYGEFSKIFEFIQHRYGIYSAGMRAYLTDGVLYVYPPFEMELDRDPKLTILKTAPKSYVGATNYHDSTDTELKIICSTDTTHQTLSNVTAENDGNSRLFLKADELIDGQVDHSTMKSLEMAVAVTNKLDNSISSRSVIARYHRPTINVFSHSSRLMSGSAEMVGIGWQYARLYSIQPGTPVNFCFDEKDKVMTKSGIVESVDYNITRSGDRSGIYVYSCTASILLRLDLDVKILEL